MGKLDSRVAFVAGAAVGIGRSIAEHFAREGAAVFCVDVREKGAGETVAAIESAGGRAASARCDVTDSIAVRNAVERAIEAFGRLDVVVCNAAVITRLTPLADLEESEWRRALDVNLTGAFLVCKHAIPALVEAGGGSIILVASQMARVASHGSAAYCTTKGGLLQLAKAIALDYPGRGIRANTLSPGGVATHRMLSRFADIDTARREWGARHPLGRLGEPLEIARAALFLACDDSSFMTGTDLLIDGGYTAW